MNISNKSVGCTIIKRPPIVSDKQGNKVDNISVERWKKELKIFHRTQQRLKNVQYLLLSLKTICIFYVWRNVYKSDLWRGLYISTLCGFGQIKINSIIIQRNCILCMFDTMLIMYVWYNEYKMFIDFLLCIPI